MVWTARQRRTLAGLTIALLGVVLVRQFFHSTRIAQEPEDGALASQVQSRIDPNEADEATLAALPGIGPGLARRIVEYRKEFEAKHPGERAFNRIDDLAEVKGIGPAISATVEGHLRFDGSTTKPSP